MEIARTTVKHRPSYLRALGAVALAMSGCLTFGGVVAAVN